MDTPSPVRHKWFPVIVLLTAGTWWLWRASYAQYHTILHIMAVLVTGLALTIWYAFFGGGSRRRRFLVVAAVVGLAAIALVAFRPVYNGDMGVYRWRLRFARAADQSLAPIKNTAEIADWKPTPQDYPRFLGNGYWAEAKDVALETDWQAHPPQEVWRREIGAGWSSFAIVGDFAFTQEQRGEQEVVSCYRVRTGEPVWVHADAARFDPADTMSSLGDIGPRATPTLHNERVFTQGGTGIVNCLDARTGKVLWSHDTVKEFNTTVTTWGKSGSPLVVDDMVIISVGAPSESTPAESSTREATGEAASAAGGIAEQTAFDSSLVAFDITTGALRWHAGGRKASYASPVLATLAGERQIIVINDSWVTSHRASDGEILWEYPWANPHDGTATCPQPVPLAGDRVFLSKGYGVGCSLLQIKRGTDGKFVAEPIWQPAIKKVMKTKFSNVLVRDGFIYGLDDVLLECIEIDSGAVKWKKRRQPVFGHGQIMLIDNCILVLSESGELALVEATPDEYRELGSLQALSDANVTWNNPAFAAPYLLVRNAREAACYRFPVRQQSQ